MTLTLTRSMYQIVSDCKSLILTRCTRKQALKHFTWSGLTERQRDERTGIKQWTDSRGC